MEKGKLGIRLAFYGVAAFILAVLGYSTPLFLLAGVVVIAEKNEWATRQVLQAICLLLVSSVISTVLSVATFMYDIPFISSVWRMIVNMVDSVASLIVIIFGVVGVLKNAKGEDAGIPLASDFAVWACGIAKGKTNSDQCPSCGADLKGGAFCPSCGKSAKEEAKAE